MNCISTERLELFVDIITFAIDAGLQTLWHYSYTFVIDFSRRIAQVALALIFHLFVGLETRPGNATKPGYTIPENLLVMAINNVGV